MPAVRDNTALSRFELDVEAQLRLRIVAAPGAVSVTTPNLTHALRWRRPLRFSELGTLLALW